jgi:hypothetical protein
MTITRPSAENKRMQIAKRLIELSDHVLSVAHTKSGYVVLKLGQNSNSNVITIWNNRTSCFINNFELLENARAAGFHPEPVIVKRKSEKDRFRFRNLTGDDIEKHEELFRKIVKDSIDLIQFRRGPKLFKHSNARK